VNQLAISAFAQTAQQNQKDQGARPCTKKDLDLDTLRRIAVSSFMLA
jgi:hypothetical protein